MRSPACSTSASTIVSGLSQNAESITMPPAHCLSSHFRVKGTQQWFHPWKALDLRCGLSLGAADWREQHYRASWETTPAGLVVDGQGAVHASNRWPICGSTSLTAGTQKPRGRGVEMGVAPLIIIPTSLMEQFLLSIPSTLCSVSLESLVPRGGILPPGNTDVVSLNWKIFPLVMWSFVWC